MNKPEGFACPYCDYVHEDWWEYIDPVEEEGEFNTHCEVCDRQFHIKFKANIEFTSSKVFDPEFDFEREPDEDPDEEDLV